MSYKNLEIWKEAREISIRIHEMSLTIIYALSSNDETIDHLEILYETKSLTDELVHQELHQRLEVLGRKINNFLIAVERSHGKPYQVNDPEVDYSNPETTHQHPESSIQNPSL